MSDPLYRAAEIQTGQQLITPVGGEAKRAVDSLGYSTQASEWEASAQIATGLTPVHRLYNATTHDYLYSASAAQIDNAIAKQGYSDDGVVFYASMSGSVAQTCANTLIYSAIGPRGVRHYSDDPTSFGSGYGVPSAQFWVHGAGKSDILTAAPYFDSGTSAWHAYESAVGSTKREYYNIAATPISIWLHGRESDGNEVRRVTTAAQAQNRVPQFVLYAIPGRDCGGFSDGGVADDASYDRWIDRISAGIGDRQAIVIMEPDAISFCNNNPETREVRTRAMTYAAKVLYDNNPGVYTYLHAGSGTLALAYARNALIDSGIKYMRGFAMNVSGLGATQEEESYGDQLIGELSAAGYPDKTYVVDTSRNGVGRAPNPGASYNSCNNYGAALGTRPTSDTNDPNADAYLWIKVPGESDGSACHPQEPGQPRAGAWFPQLAHDLFINAVAAGTVADWQIGDSPYTDQV